jgi:AcrR family transcriptional regulator
MPRPKLEDARPRLLAAGLRLFANRGTERVNSNAIARWARLGIGTFYAHFSDKYALLHEIQVRTLEGIQRVRKTAVSRAGADPETQVYHAVRAVVRFAERHPEAYRVTFGRERLGSGHRSPTVQESSRPTAEVLRRLQAKGDLDPDFDPDLAARAYASMEVGMLLWWLEAPGRAVAADLVDTLARLHPVAACRRHAE